MQGQAPAEGVNKQPSAPVPAAEMESTSRGEYQKQAVVWENRVKTHPSDENAWLNLFKARLYENYSAHSRKVSQQSRSQLAQIVRSIGENAPQSFTYFFCDYLQKQKTDSGLESLRKAAEKAPEQPELLDDMMFYYIRYADAQRITHYAMKTQAAGVYPAAVMEYNRNVLNSTEQGAILVTYGAQDTYPLIILQYAQQFRQDVRVVCLEWLVNDSYRSTVQQTLHPNGTLSADDDANNLLRMCSASAGAVYAGLTLPPDVLGEVRKNLYCTGLTLKYSNSPIVNLPSLAYSWEKLFSKNYISSTEDINVNYLIPLIELHDYYTKKDTAKASEIKALILSVAARFGKTGVVQSYIR